MLQQIGEAINAGYKYIVQEVPTGFGKSPVAIAVGGAYANSTFVVPRKTSRQYTTGVNDSFVKVIYEGPKHSNSQRRFNYSY